MVQITELGYIGLGVSDLEKWKGFASNILALEIVDTGEKDRCYFRLDNWHHRIIVEQDGTDDLNFMGLRVAGVEEFRAMQRQLSDAGVAFRVCSREEAEERHVLELMKLEDPSGNPIEIFHGPHIQYDKPFHPGRRMHGRFKTGGGGMGHMMLRETAGQEKTYEFYKLLGMRGGVEYKIPVPDLPQAVELLFMHCNERDHTFAFGVPSQKRINHLMIEVENFDDVGLAYEIVQANKLPVAIAPGRHSNDHMYSFYFVNPSGWMCEIGWGAREATHQSEYYQSDIYGHGPVEGVTKGIMEVNDAAE